MISTHQVKIINSILTQHKCTDCQSLAENNTHYTEIIGDHTNCHGWTHNEFETCPTCKKR